MPTSWGRCEIDSVRPATITEAANVPDLSKCSGGVVTVSLADGSRLTTDTSRLASVSSGATYGGFQRLAFETEFDRKATRPVYED
jgi:hypothetical protein